MESHGKRNIIVLEKFRFGDWLLWRVGLNVELIEAAFSPARCRSGREVGGGGFRMK